MYHPLAITWWGKAGPRPRRRGVVMNDLISQPPFSTAPTPTIPSNYKLRGKLHPSNSLIGGPAELNTYVKKLLILLETVNNYDFPQFIVSCISLSFQYWCKFVIIYLKIGFFFVRIEVFLWMWVICMVCKLLILFHFVHTGVWVFLFWAPFVNVWMSVIVHLWR